MDIAQEMLTMSNDDLYLLTKAYNCSFNKMVVISYKTLKALVGRPDI